MSGSRIYLASSWRNPHQPWMVDLLRQNGHQVYDFRNIDIGQIVASLRGAEFTHDSIARIWPKLCAKLARQVALLPVPGAPA